MSDAGHIYDIDELGSYGELLSLFFQNLYRSSVDGLIVFINDLLGLRAITEYCIAI